MYRPTYVIRIRTGTVRCRMYVNVYTYVYEYEYVLSTVRPTRTFVDERRRDAGTDRRRPFLLTVALDFRFRRKWHIYVYVFE